jgi:hypothetical protein
MRRSIPLFLALTLVAVACDRQRNVAKERALAARALQDVLGYPGSSIVNFAAGSDAGQIDLSTGATVEDVAKWYRQALPLNGWEIHNDASDSRGVVTIYAEKRKQPLWITLRPNVGGPGTTYTLIGTIADSTKQAP